jgi:hypothetical protein
MSQLQENALVPNTQNLFKCLKTYFDFLDKKNEAHEFGCKIIESKLVCDILDQLKTPLFQIKPKKSSKIDHKNYIGLMENLVNYCIVQMFEQFLLSNGFVGTINSFVIDEVNRLFRKYTKELTRLSKEADEHDLSLEEQNQKRERLYNCFISSVKTIAMDLVPTYEEFYKSEINWKVDSSTGTALHILTNTFHELTDSVLPYYLGTSVLEEKPVSVFMDGQSGEVFTMAIK